MQMIFIRAPCDSSGDDYGYWFLSVLTLSCTLSAVCQRNLLVWKISGQLPRVQKIRALIDHGKEISFK